MFIRSFFDNNDNNSNKKMSSSLKNVCHLRNGGTSVVIDLRTTDVVGLPIVAYWGADLGANVSVAQLESLTRSIVLQTVSGGLTYPPRATILPHEAHGWQGTPGLTLLRQDSGSFAFDLRVSNVKHEGQSIVVEAADKEAQVEASISLEVQPSGLFSQHITIKNVGQSPLDVQDVSLTFPIPQTANELLDTTGRHLRERHPQRHAFTVGRHARESRRGRPGADATLVIAAGAQSFGFERGLVHAIHLAWSGNQRTAAERGPNYASVLQAGELFGPGEMVLGPKASYKTPVALGSWGHGLSALSYKYHDYLRQRAHHVILPRPVTINTWEAVYFDMRLDKLKAIADAAASVGAERFVLDDGWFRGRRNDDAGLGDWFVDEKVWPNGLKPLWDHVDGLGMQCGIWVEPEHVNLNTDVARAHPDWILRPTQNRLPVVGRDQYVMDLSNSAAYDYLLTCLDDLLKANPLIKYFKWDHNRDLIDSGDAKGRYAVHNNVEAVYRLMDTLKQRHPGLEIESCASGGARVDVGILEHTDRIWTSDCTDPLERLTIQKYTNLLVPSELMGAHIGAHTSHTTGRTHSLALRAGHALFAHMGIEWDISAITPDERAQVAKWIALHIKWRDVIHTGHSVYADLPSEFGYDVRGAVAIDKKRAVYTFVQVTTSQFYPLAPITFPGLDANTAYRITMADVQTQKERFVGQSELQWADAKEPCILTGAMLERIGVQPPTVWPETLLVFEVEAV